MIHELRLGFIVIITLSLLIAVIVITKKVRKTKFLFVILPIIFIWAVVCIIGLAEDVIRAVKESVGPGFPVAF